MKKFFKKCILLLIFVLMFTLTSCNKNQKIIEEKILAINTDFNKKIISEYGLIYDGKDISYLALIKDKLVMDNKKINEETTRYFESAYYNNKIFFSYIFDEGKIIVGYINTDDYLIVNTYISSEMSGVLFIEQINDNYCIFYKTNYMVHNKYVEYYIYDYRTNSIIEFDSDSNGIDKNVINKYKLDVKSNISRSIYTYNNETYSLYSYDDIATIKSDTIIIDINYEYILEKSTTLKEINAIVGNKIGQLAIDMFAIGEDLYIVLYSELTKFGSGNLIPVIFKYDISLDTFYYIGSTPYKKILFID